MRKRIVRLSFLKLVLISALVGLLSATLAVTLKRITAHYEDKMLEAILPHRLLLVIFPAIGLLLIFLLRTWLFKKKKNLGIKEIYKTLDTRHDQLPAYKIPSHYINGFLTVIFGGSTGVEVSTVVATATVGAVTGQKVNMPRKYKAELICAGVAAGVTALFGSPLTGLLFALEVIARKVTRTVALSVVTAITAAQVLLSVLHEKPLFVFHTTGWQWRALPYILLLSVLAGLIAVLFTRSVIYIKYRFASVSNDYVRIGIGAAIIGVLVCLLPQLFGDGYFAITDMLNKAMVQPFTLPFAFTLLAVVLIKPFISSVTLGAGGDGGVFAPSIVIGSLLGLLIAVLFNQYLGTELIIVNFMVIGIAAVLSASIHAPLTATALGCCFTGGYVIAIPVFLACVISRYVASSLYKDTVYTYKA
ncbi:chloride channel protein, CIC family [Filimonas lacunae]|uniref:Chloride channel protein, CIC family n=1 Tax=Filimonas lacunae TaxID=477680 RepID=A0A173MK96_9BACT|nr:chloride channel protein [Filimonas lacunae]BAV07897.1 chloride channel, voltage-gated family protein [Filimonas lacunae]SIT06169.1 chloride channel protein, CIC family [Filimonas lacunae]